jgi:hypothetical protein
VRLIVIVSLSPSSRAVAFFGSSTFTHLSL